MNTKRIISILLMVLCLGIFFFSAFKQKQNRNHESETPKAEFVEGAFHDQGELWDYLQSHPFVCQEADSLVMTVKNFELYMNGEAYSSGLELCDFQYSAAALSGYTMQGERFRMVVMKQDTFCSITDMTDSKKIRSYVAKP